MLCTAPHFCTKRYPIFFSSHPTFLEVVHVFDNVRLSGYEYNSKPKVRVSKEGVASEIYWIGVA